MSLLKQVKCLDSSGSVYLETGKIYIVIDESDTKYYLDGIYNEDEDGNPIEDEPLAFRKNRFVVYPNYINQPMSLKESRKLWKVL